MKLNINNFRNTLKTVLEYLFPVEKVTSYFKSIKSKEDLQKFIQQRSAHVTQTTLYGYLKTRMGHKFTLMVDDEEFSKSINLAKWNIYMVALADCSFYVFSILISEKNLKQNDCREVFLNIIENEKKNGLSEEIYTKAKTDFLNRIEKIANEKIYSLFIVDAALIIEGGSFKYYHESGAYIILLTSPKSIRIERALSRGNLSEKSIKERMSLQWEDDKKKEYADYIIENSASLDQLKSSITFILKEIRENEKHN